MSMPKKSEQRTSDWIKMSPWKEGRGCKEAVHACTNTHPSLTGGSEEARSSKAPITGDGKLGGNKYARRLFTVLKSLF